MTRCSNQKCPHGVWIHNECAGLPEEFEPGVRENWWCSEECVRTGASILCVCKLVGDGPTIICANGDDCKRGIQFHLTCVHLQEIPGMTFFLSYLPVTPGFVVSE